MARFVVDCDGGEAASVVFGRAEIFEREPAEYALARLSWEQGRSDAACAVMAAAAQSGPGGEKVYFPVNAGVHGDHVERCRIAEDCGFRLFQEKEGFWWADTGQVLPEPAGLRLHSMARIGREQFAPVIGRCLAGTLDRIDALVLGRCPPREWAETFLQRHAQPADEDTWLFAETPDGAPVGFVGVAAHDADPRTGVLVLIGVLPEQRGNHYVDELVHAANRAARARGMTGVLSLVDVQNQPMMAAMRRTGWSAETHPWHRWLYVTSNHVQNPAG